MTMTPAEFDALRAWIGREENDEDTLDARHAGLMAATVDRAGGPPATGEALPPLWHWLYFLQGLPPGRLGRDGHPARGGFLPPVPLSNRLWAGGRVQFEAPLAVGEAARKRSTVQAIEHKRGRSGDLVFVTVCHELWRADGTRALREEQDLVYREPPPPGASPPAPQPVHAAEHRRRWQPDATELFRYSALTFNGHRIHYDADYCRAVEGYAGLVVHGPLIATRLANLAQELLGRPLRHFAYRGLRPTIVGQPVHLHARAEGEGLRLWSALDDGGPTMQAEAG